MSEQHLLMIIWAGITASAVVVWAINEFIDARRVIENSDDLLDELTLDAVEWRLRYEALREDVEGILALDDERTKEEQ